MGIEISKNAVIVGIVAVVAIAVVSYLLASGIISLPAGSKYRSGEEVADATVQIGGDVERVGSILEDIDSSLS